MFNKTLLAAVIILGFWTPVMADDDAPDTAGGRYTLNKVMDGFVRLDTQTGAVEFCSQRTVGWACQAAPEDRATYEREIERLQNENAALKQALLSHGLPLPDDLMPETSGCEQQSNHDPAARQRRCRSRNDLCRTGLATLRRCGFKGPEADAEQDLSRDPSIAPRPYHIIRHS